MKKLWLQSNENRYGNRQNLGKKHHHHANIYPYNIHLKNEEKRQRRKNQNQEAERGDSKLQHYVRQKEKRDENIFRERTNENELILSC